MRGVTLNMSNVMKERERDRERTCAYASEKEIRKNMREGKEKDIITTPHHRPSPQTTPAGKPLHRGRVNQLEIVIRSSINHPTTVSE